jgi:hypothetical protein
VVGVAADLTAVVDVVEGAVVVVVVDGLEPEPPPVTGVPAES